MTGETRPDGRDRWHEASLALLGGLVAASFMFFLIAAIRTPGLDPPPESAALLVIATTAGTVSYGFLRRDSVVGYPAAMLTGGYIVVAVAAIGIGVYGPAGPRTNPVGPASYLALTAAVIVASGLAWRGRRASKAVPVR